MNLYSMAEVGLSFCLSVFNLLIMKIYHNKEKRKYIIQIKVYSKCGELLFLQVGMEELPWFISSSWCTYPSLMSN